VSCDYHAPVIGEVQYRLNVTNDLKNQKVYQKLSVFISAQDQDGSDDIIKLYIIHDQTEVYWTLESDDWQKTKEASRPLIGTNALVMPNLDNFPGGEYRILLEDLSGTTTEKSFYLYTNQDNFVKDKNAFPTGYEKGQKLYIQSKYEKVSIWLSRRMTTTSDQENSPGNVSSNNTTSTGAGEVLASLQITHGNKGISYQTLRSKVPALPVEFTYYLYVYDNQQNLGLISGPYYFPSF
jgi:hypothetical protein